MASVEPPGWRDQLADEVRELETLARLDDPVALARNMLRVVRAFEVRVRQVALRTDHLDPHKEFRLPKRW